MRPFTSTISFDEACARLTEAARPIQRTERVSLRECLNRVAAEDVSAPTDVPPFARSAMDGYAVVADDLIGGTEASPVILRVADQIFTGQSTSLPIEPGRCAQIATGAPLPSGADTVVMVEHTRTVASGHVAFVGPAQRAQHVVRCGSDMRAGEGVVARGDVMNPGRIGALAAIGRRALVVYARPEVAIVSTGSEISGSCELLSGGQIHDVNSFTLGAIVETHGGVVRLIPPVPDTICALHDAFDACSGADVMIFSGGTSVGERDFVIELIEARGALVFHGVALKPGMPLAFALCGTVPFFGMPGSPASCLSNAYVLLAPFLRMTARLPPPVEGIARVPLGRRIESRLGRHQVCSVRLDKGLAMPAFKGSGEITSLSRADGYIQIPADQQEVDEGTLVDVTLF